MTKEIIYLDDMKNTAMNCFNFLISNLTVHEDKKGQFVLKEEADLVAEKLLCYRIFEEKK
jgi:hypothetical protein